MGVHISLVTVSERDGVLDYDDIPESQWDFLRHAGDSEWATIMTPLPQVRHPNYGDVLFRPADFDAWRAAMPAERDNPERIPTMLAILEARPDVWVSVSW